MPPADIRRTTSDHVRVRTDLAVKLAAVVRYHRKLTAPEVLDPLIRGHIEAEFASLPHEYRMQVATESRVA